MRVTIVTPVKNGARFIRETVQSVLSQQGNFELEYIVRDGDSTDDTLSILAEFAADPRLQVVSEPDGGPQQAINAGMAAATGDILAWLNADDIYEPGALQAVVETFGAEPRCKWLYGRCRIVDAEGNRIRLPITWYKNLLGFFYSRNVLLCENYICQPATFWRAELWQQSGGLSTRWKAAWDYELWLRMQSLTRPKSLHTVLACFRRHGGGIGDLDHKTQFQEEVEAARPYGNALTNAIHRLNAWRTVKIYRMLSSAQTRNSPTGHGA